MPRTRTRATNSTAALKIAAKTTTQLRPGRKSPIAGKQHVDVLFLDTEVDALDRDGVLLGVSTRADVVRSAVKKQRWLIQHCETDDIVTVTDKEGRLRFRVPVIMVN